MNPDRGWTGDSTHSSRFRQAGPIGTGAGLCVAVMSVVVTAVMVVPSGRERRARTYQHQKRGEDELLHAMTIARFCRMDMTTKM